MPTLKQVLASSEQRLFVYVKDGNIRINGAQYSQKEKKDLGIELVGMFCSIAYYQNKSIQENYVTCRNKIPDKLAITGEE